MKMKYKKKHQKKFLNFSVLILFMLVLNINSTYMFKNYDSLYITDNYEDDHEDLSPELIIESPKNADYNNHLDFMPYGTYIYAPNYIQRFVNQTTFDYIYFRLYDANGGGFSKFRVYVDGILSKSEDWPSNEPNFYIRPHIESIGIYNITTQAFSDRSHEWVTHNSILNVTLASPCISPFYEDFLHIQNWGSNLDWNIDALDPSYYNYTIYINGANVDSQTNSYNNDISFYYPGSGDFNTLGKVNEIRLEIIDETGKVTINQFNITNVADSDPYINQLEKNCEQINYLTLWETEGFIIRTSASSPQNDLDKIVVTVNNLPVYTIDNAVSNTEYEAPIDTNIIHKLKDEYGNIDTNLNFRAIAVTKDGRSSIWDYSPSQYMELRYYNYEELIETTEDVNSGRNIETLEMTEMRNYKMKYSLTVVTDVLSPTTLTIASSTGSAFENSWETLQEHCYDRDNGMCNIFGQFDTDKGWFQGGMVFWISVANQTAVQFPMTVKIVYPEEMQPDEIDKNWNLQFMHWIENCRTNDRDWFLYSNESVSQNRDETIKEVGENAIEVLIYSQGLYAFGIEPGEEGYYREGFYISSFPIGLFIFSFGIAAMTISLKFKSKIKNN